MKLYDTVRGAIVPFEPGPVVRIYTCGITPYDATHLGHAATYVTYDLVHRRLLDLGHDVRLVRNITDVDDDLLRRAERDGINYLDLAFGEKRRFDEDLERLGNLEPWSEPRATSAIPDIRGLIGDMVDTGAAYRVGDTVYFDHAASPVFGRISNHSESEMLRIGAERGEDPDDPNKRHPLDAVLWKPSGEGEPAWESPWGRGRPGWHIECTALAYRELGPAIDLHGGGCDLVYPHHEFCSAQTASVVDGSTVGIWMHQACVQLHGRPMSKSTGNLVFVDDLFRSHDPMAVRLAVMSVHYRSSEWDWEAHLLERATERLDLWRAAGSGAGPVAEVGAALDDDLDAPAALELIDDAARTAGVTDAAALLGVRLADSVAPDA